MGSTLALIQAGAIPNAIPVTTEMAKANNSTGVDGAGLIGIPAEPGAVGKAKYRISRVPANATARPAAPPISDSRMLSVKACLTSRVTPAPRAMLSDVCWRRSNNHLTGRNGNRAAKLWTLNVIMRNAVLPAVNGDLPIRAAMDRDHAS